MFSCKVGQNEQDGCSRAGALLDSCSELWVERLHQKRQELKWVNQLKPFNLYMCRLIPIDPQTRLQDRPGKRTLKQLAEVK